MGSLMDAAAAIDGARSVGDVLKRVGSEELLTFMRRMGFWTSDLEVGQSRRTAAPPKKFTGVPDVAQMGRETLGDQLAYWASEFGRACEVLGVLEGELKAAKLRLKRAEARAARDAYKRLKEEEARRPTKTEVDLDVALDPEVQTEEDKVVLLTQAITAIAGFKEAAGAYRDAISREITRRGDVYRGGMQP